MEGPLEPDRRRPDRLAGVAVPLSALRAARDSGIGEIHDLTSFVEWASAAGQRLVALLPLGELAPGESSPYNAISTFAIDPLYVTLAEVPELAGIAAAEDPPPSDPRRIDRERVRAWKEPLFAVAFERFARLPEGCVRRRAFAAFRQAQADWLSDYALFRALAEENGFRSWHDWPDELRRRRPDALRRATARLDERIARLEYLQFLAEEQWWRTRETARARGVRLMGDLPFAPSANSADVWANQRFFDPSRTVGAPPDDFSATGQRWGLPMYRWRRMRTDGFRWFRRRFHRLADLYDLYRIDHVVGLFRTYAFRDEVLGRFDPPSVPAQKAQGREILEIALVESGPGSIVAEDLGSIPGYVRECMAALDVPGYKVFRWERDESGFVDPRRYPECSIATTGTHDNEPVVLWWRTLSEDARREVLSVVDPERAPGDAPREMGTEARERLLRLLYASRSRFVILPIQDLFGWEERINVPASVAPENWSFRMPVSIDALRSDPASRDATERLRAFVDESERLEKMGTCDDSPAPGPRSS